jgi:sigma-E factor negative regulatory protein RseA
MSESTRERLSALIDGELDQAEAVRLLDEVTRGSELQRTWEHYHLISDALQGHMAPGLPMGDLFERVRERVQEEPTMYRLRAFRAPGLRPLAGLAIAASVAVVAVLGLRGVVPGSDGGTNQVAQRPATEPVAVAVAGDPTSTFDPRLSAYLLNHNELAGQNMHGVLPYARLVAHDGGR